MPNYSNEPPKDPRGRSLQLIRCPVMRPLMAIVTSDDLIGTRTHFYGGRTVPCGYEGCEICLNGVPWRWHSYLSAWEPATKKHFLFENTARATEIFVQYRRAHGFLRGCFFRAQRMNARPNARVYIETKPADLEKHPIPESPDLEKILAIIWNLPFQQVKAEGTSKSVPHVQVDQATPSIPLTMPTQHFPANESFQRKPA